MSEFSESYHLRSERTEDAITLLRRAGCKGYVCQASGGWVTFVADGGIFEPDELIVGAAEHPLLHYVHAEDHGWSFTLFDGTEVISACRCDWDEEMSIDRDLYSRSALQRFVKKENLPLLAEFERHLGSGDMEGILEAEPIKTLAKALGLENYEWLSYSYIADDSASSDTTRPKIIQVD